MKPTLRQFKQLFVMLCLVIFADKAYPQTSYQGVTHQLKEFTRHTNEASVIFTLPEGFKEISEQANELGLDYGITVPGKDIEIWFAVRSYKYLLRHYPNNPDSVYLKLGKEQAEAFNADNDYFVRNLSPRILAQYKADEGRSYLINLSDDPETKHYKYALVLVLQKNRTGCITAVCFTNEKGPEFFKSIDKARNCIKFKS